MSQDVTIAGATYSDVPYITVPTSDGGTAKFVDTSDSTVAPETLIEGSTAFSADGEPIDGVNPYELNATNAKVNEQANLIEQIQNTLVGKVVGNNGSVIIDVLELPTEIDKNAFYRVTKADFYGGSLGDELIPWVLCNVVETLPQSGITWGENNECITYYALDTGTVSAYVDEETSTWLGLPVGWTTAEEFLYVWDGIEFKGVFNSIQNTGIYLLLESDLYAGSDKLVKASSSDYPKVLTLDLTHIEFDHTIEGNSEYFRAYIQNLDDPIFLQIANIGECDMVRIKFRLRFGENNYSDAEHTLAIRKNNWYEDGEYGVGYECFASYVTSDYIDSVYCDLVPGDYAFIALGYIR